MPTVSGVIVYSGVEQTTNIATSDKYTITGDKGTNAYSYTAIVTLVDKDNSKWADGSTAEISIDWSIIPEGTISMPVYHGNTVYTGIEQTADFAINDKYTISRDKGTNAGKYTATATLNDPVNTAWADGSTAALEVSWEIAKAIVDAPTHDSSYISNGTLQYLNIPASDHYDISGDTQGSNAGRYTAVASLNNTENTSGLMVLLT